MEYHHGEYAEDLAANNGPSRHTGRAGAFKRPVAPVKGKRNGLTGKACGGGSYCKHHGKYLVQAMSGERLQVGRANEQGQRNDDAQQLLLAVAQHEFCFHLSLREQHGAGAGPFGGRGKGSSVKGRAHVVASFRNAVD